MNMLKNEQGYALVTVLLIITIFAAVFLSFMGQAFSSVKQNQIVEKNTQATAIAEMGMSYYQTAIKNAFVSKQMEYDADIESIHDTITEDDIAQAIRDAINLELQNGKTKKFVDGNSDIFFKVDDNISVTNVARFLDIEFSVTGTQGTKQTSLSTEMNINLENLTINVVPTTVPLLPNYSPISEPQNIDSKCIDPDENHDFSKDPCPNGVIITQPNQTYTDNFQKFSGTIYATDAATGVLTLGGVGNKSSLRIRGDSLDFGGVQNNVTSVIMEAKSNVTFDGHLTATNSKFFIGGNLEVNGKFELKYDSATSTDSMYYTLVRGNLTIPKTQTDMYIGTNNTVCVDGNFSVTGWVENHGTIYVNKDKVFFKLDTAKSTGLLKFVENVPEAELISQCGNVFKDPGTYIDWGENAKTMVDIVDYN